jgi:rod shape-determining protein MreC
MPLGTVDRTPPPFFRQGPSAGTKLGFFAALALFLMVADSRLHLMEPLRSTITVGLLPVQRTLAVPVRLVQGGGAYLRGLSGALGAERAARAQLAAQSARLAQAERQAAENAWLRALLDLRHALPVRSVPAEVLFEAADPYTRRVVVDRGASHGVVAGAPVVNEAGVLGQVTRVHPLTSEVTLLADKDAAIPVLNVRTQQRAAAFGGAPGGAMELRFTSANADVKTGDLLHTSGLDGVYPPGLPVAVVTGVERRVESGFARILLAPAAAPDGVRFVLLLEPVAAQLPPPEHDLAEAAGPALPGEHQLPTPRLGAASAASAAPAASVAPAARAASAR